MANNEEKKREYEWRIKPQPLNNDIFSIPPAPYDDNDIVKANDPTKSEGQKEFEDACEKLKNGAQNVRNALSSDALDLAAEVAYEDGLYDGRNNLPENPPSGVIALFRGVAGIAVFTALGAVAFSTFQNILSSDGTKAAKEKTTQIAAERPYTNARPTLAGAPVSGDQYAHEFPDGFVYHQSVNEVVGMGIIDGLTLSTKFTNFAGNDNGLMSIKAHVDGHYSTATANIPSIRFDGESTFGDLKMIDRGKIGLRQEFAKFALPDNTAQYLQLKVESDRGGNLSAYLSLEGYD